MEQGNEHSEPVDKGDHPEGKAARPAPEGRMGARGYWALAAALFLLLAAATGTGVAIWALIGRHHADESEHRAEEKRKKAVDEAEEFESKYHRAEAALKEKQKELDAAESEKETLQKSNADVRAVLEFLKGTLLAAGRPGNASLTEAYWAGIRDHVPNATLRESVDEAEKNVADAFQGRGLAEAEVREVLGLAYLNLGDPKRAVTQYEHALALREALQGPDQPETADCRNRLAVAYRLAGRTTDAARLFDQDLPRRADALALRGKLQLSEHKPAEAELTLRQCLKIHEKYQSDEWATFEVQSQLGEALLAQKKFAEAESHLLSAYKGIQEHRDRGPSDSDSRLTETLRDLVRLYEVWDRDEEAAKWRKKLEAASTEGAARERSGLSNSFALPGG